MKLIEKQQMQIDYILKSKSAKLITYDNVKVLLYDSIIRQEPKPTAVIFVGNAFNPESRYYYPTPERRQEEIDRVVAREKAKAAEKSERAESKKAFVPTSAAGDIFVSSWGYEQTNVDFYLLESIKGKTGTFVKIGQYVVENSEGSGGMSCYVLPAAENIIGEPFKKLISNTQGTESFSERSRFVRKWSGDKQYNSWYY